MFPLLDSSRIADYLPQAPPIVLVDNLWYSNETCTLTSLRIRPELLFVENNLFTEPGLMENIAQTAAVRAGYYHKNRQEPVPLGFIGAFKDLEIFELPEVGTVIFTKVCLKQEVLDISIFEGIV
ncbi:MAG: 3-hydroxyacyl-ACP dehydratase [Saprospiraceae bacterium]|nr:3-hydroxyacyl-ACP dehydratase [Saprospiraceae bacterium]